jgi:chromosome segregation ATPase
MFGAKSNQLLKEDAELESKIAEKRQIILNLEANIAGLERESSEHSLRKQSLEEIEKSIEAMRPERDSLATQINEQQKQALALDAVIFDKQATIDALIMEEEKVTTRLSDARRQLSDIQTRTEKEQHDFDVMVEQHDSAFIELENRKTSAAADLKELERNIEASQEVISVRTTLKEDLTKDIAAKKEELSKVSKEFTELTESVVNLMRQHADIVASIEKVRETQEAEKATHDAAIAAANAILSKREGDASIKEDSLEKKEATLRKYKVYLETTSGKPFNNIEI